MSDGATNGSMIFVSNERSLAALSKDFSLEAGIPSSFFSGTSAFAGVVLDRTGTGLRAIMLILLNKVSHLNIRYELLRALQLMISNNITEMKVVMVSSRWSGSVSTIAR